MLKNKNPLLVANWKDNISTLTEAKNLLKDIYREYTNFTKLKQKLNKKKPLKKDLAFYLALPAPFIFPMQDFLKENKTLNKILIGAQNFDSVEKIDKSNNLTLAQIKSSGAKFTILHNQNLNDLYKKLSRDNAFSLTTEKEPAKLETHNIILDRLNAVSRKFDEKIALGEKRVGDLDSELELELKKNYEKEIQDLEEKIKAALLNKVTTLFIIQDEKNDLELLAKLIKKLIRNIHYNLLNYLIIGFQASTENSNLDILDIESCQEKAIVIRRTVANLFGMDNAKKVRILYSGLIDELNVLEILENGGVDGILLTGESLSPKTFSKILSQLT